MNESLQKQGHEKFPSQVELLKNIEAHRIQLEALLHYMSSQGLGRSSIVEGIGQSTTRVLRDFRRENGLDRFTHIPTPTPPIPLVKLLGKEAPIPLVEEDIIHANTETTDYLARNGDTRILKIVPSDEMLTPLAPNVVVGELVKETEPTQSTIPYVANRTLGEAAMLFADREIHYTLENDGSVTPLANLNLDFSELEKCLQSNS